MRLKINEDIRLKILDSITSCQNSHKHMHFSGGSDRLNNAIKNSIVDGKIGEVSEEWLKKHPENIIKNTIQNISCRYGKRYYNKPCVASVESIWYNVMKAGDFHVIHSHQTGSLEPSYRNLSGAIYLEVPDNLPEPQGNVCWVMGQFMGSTYDPFWQYLPEPGDVFLWPSWLMHMVYPFRSKQERIMIAFNGQTVCK